MVEELDGARRQGHAPIPRELQAGRCRANAAHARESRPGSGHVFQVNVLTLFPLASAAARDKASELELRLDSDALSLAAPHEKTGSLGAGVGGSGSRLSGFGFRVSGFGFRVSGFGFRVSGLGFRV